MTTITRSLKEFQWRPTQRRMYPKNRDLIMRIADQINIIGETTTITFRFIRDGEDPHKKTPTKSRIYHPIDGSPEDVKDIVLYVHY